MVALEHAAAELERLRDAELDELRYALHRGAELVHGLAPPAGAYSSHAELADALEDARDATATMADALADGGLRAASPLVWEWRGSLFRIRLAWLRIDEGGRHLHEPGEDEAEARSLRGPLIAILLILCGVGLVLVGALVEVWPLWTGGIALVLGSVPLSSRRA